MIDLVAWVRASNRRVEILETLAEDPQCPSDFAQRWGLETESAMNYMRKLRRGNDGEFPGLIECVTPGRKNYRLYSLTDMGEVLVKDWL